MSGGFALADVITRLHDLVCLMDLPSSVTIALLTSLAETENRLSTGGSDRLQNAGLVAAFIKARRLIAESA